MSSVIRTQPVAAPLAPPVSPAEPVLVRAGTEKVRCECRVCGAHAYARAGVKASGRCGNCGSIDLAPLH